MMLSITDNFLNNEYADMLEKELTSIYFPWYYYDHTTISKKFKTDCSLDTPQFVHVFYGDERVNSSAFELVYPLISVAGCSFDKLHRVKANLIYRHPNFPESFYNLPHSDGEEGIDTETLIYYINDSDGDTVIFNEKTSINSVKLTEFRRINPAKNKAVLFDSSYLHASSPPRQHDIRIVLNFIFQK